MRTSEKILLAFITIGIVSLGSFVGWKYYERANPRQEQNVGAVAPNASQNQSKKESLSVRDLPYSYNASPKTNKEEKPASSNENKNTTDTNNSNSNNSQANTNTNSGNLVKASLSPNNNSTGNENKNATSNPVGETKSFTFAVIGDSQGFEPGDAKGALQKAVGSITKANVDVVMTVGDLVSSCDGNECTEHLSNWKKAVAPILPKTKLVMGNHDRTGGDSSDRRWQEAFELPANGPEGYSELVYSFDYDNSHFVVLNSEKPEEHSINSTQRDWLEQDLSANTKENIFVFFHEPAYPVSSKINESLDVNKSHRDALWEILKRYNVTAVFSGHEHIMSRRSVDGIYQFVVGNTDAFDHDSPKPGVAEYAYRGHHFALVNVKGKEIPVKIYKVEGILLDSFVVPR